MTLNNVGGALDALSFLALSLGSLVGMGMHTQHGSSSIGALPT